MQSAEIENGHVIGVFAPSKYHLGTGVKSLPALVVGKMRLRKRRFEKLEARQLLTACINEILFDPLFGDDNTEQYVELRGTPSSSLAQGTYLVVVESEKGFNNSEGKIHGIFDLSGQAFGSNGFLVLLPMDSPFTPDPAANTLQSTEEAFGGLPGDIYQDSHPLSDRIDFQYASNTFFLIETDVAPQLGDDVDADSDGLIDPDGIVSDWTILDSISTMWGLNDGNGYGEIVFVDTGDFDPEVTVAAGTTVVEVDGTGYVGRIGNSVGSAATDWVGGTVRDYPNDEYFYRLNGDIHGRPVPVHLHGRELDSLGSVNFTGAAHVQLFNDLDRDDIWDADEPALPSGQMFADSNSNGQRDLIQTEIDADDFAINREVRNLTPGITLSTTLEDNIVVGFDITPVQHFGRPTGDHIFSHAGVGFFNDFRRLRMDFYRPAQSVSVRFIGATGGQVTFGRLEAFDKNGNSLQMIRTSALAGEGVQQLTINRSTDDIAYAVAFSDENFQDSSPFGKIDFISFQVPEAISTSDANGRATLNYLDPGEYTLTPLPQPGDSYSFDPIGLDITKYENFEFVIPVRENEAPVFVPADFEIEERSAPATLVGTVVANDDPAQNVTFAIIEGGENFTIEPLTGIVRVKAGAVLDFETQSSHVIRVRATDDAFAPLSSEADFTITLSDINEPPVIGNYTFEIAENPTAGTLLGVVQAIDPDAGFNGILGYRIVGTNLGSAVGIDGLTGELTVNNVLPYNFESRQEIIITVEAFDSGSPSLKDTSTVTIKLLDVNEPPRITTSNLSVGELLPGGGKVGTVQAQDVDAGQSHTFSWAEGFTSELFEIVPSTGDVLLANGASLSFADQPQHEIRVRVTDSGNPVLSHEATIVINVGDQNNPPEIAALDLNVDENEQAGTVLGTVSVSDPDIGQTYIFAIVDGTGKDLFAIGQSTGEITVATDANINFESGATLTLTVQVWDSGQPIATTQRTLEVVVNDLPESPVVSDAQFDLAENSAVGAVVGTVQFSDPDAGDEATIELLASDGSDNFVIDSLTGEITVAPDAVLDFETQAEYDLQVRVTDGVTPAVLGNVKVRLLDRNDAPQATTELEPLTALAGFPIDVTLPADLFSDPDAGQTLEWTLTTTSGLLPRWINFNPLTRRITGTPWNPQAGELSMVVVAVDNGLPAMHIELPWSWVIEENTAPWMNVNEPLDVNGNTQVQSIDALVIINYLNRVPDDRVPMDVEFRPAFMDVNGNNRVEPIDALQIINYLNRNPSGEGEAPVRSIEPANGWNANSSTTAEDELRRRRVGWEAALEEYLREVN